MKIKEIKNIVIAGNGWGGWYTALSFMHNFKNVSVTVIGSSKIPGLPVGESLAWNAPYSFNQLLGLSFDDQREFMKKTGAIYKYGVTYDSLLADDQITYSGKTHDLKISALKKFYGNFKLAILGIKKLYL